jgi:hypothetical protein
MPEEPNTYTPETSRGRAERADSSGPFATLRNEWVRFIVLILNPLFLSTIFVASVFMVLKGSVSANQSLPAPVDTFFTLVIALTSGVAGALFSDRWIKSRETSTLVTRGKSAIRGLRLILTNIGSQEQRIERYGQLLASIDEEQESKQRFYAKISYEEITAGYHRLQEEVINAIEEWQDIIPEVANLKTQIGVISELNTRMMAIQQERTALELKLDEERKKSDKDQAQLQLLQHQVKQKEKELKQVTEQRDAQRDRFSSTIIGDISTSSGLLYTAAPHNLNVNLSSTLTKTCASCGQRIPYVHSLDINSNICPKCGKNSNFYLTVGPSQ